MRAIVFSLLLGAIFISTYSCKHDTGYPVTLHPNDTTHHDTTIVDPVDTSVCFKRDVLPIFQNSCATTNCHNATTHAEGYTLTDYAHIVSRGLIAGNAAGSKIYKECANGSMPEYPTPKLDSVQLSYLRRWINMGAHNDTDCIVTCDTSKFGYTNAISPILKTYCLGCHATAVASGSGGGIDLGNYDAVKVQALNGKFLGSIQHASGYSAMPKSASKLSDCKIIQVSKWIAVGAQNN